MRKNLLDIKAVSLRPMNHLHGLVELNHQFTATIVWYCLTREKRTAVVEGFVELIEKEYPEAEILMGTATAEFPGQLLLRIRKSNLPMGYVRSSNKD